MGCQAMHSNGILHQVIAWAHTCAPALKESVCLLIPSKRETLCISVKGIITKINSVPLMLRLKLLDQTQPSGQTHTHHTHLITQSFMAYTTQFWIVLWPDATWSTHDTKSQPGKHSKTYSVIYPGAKRSRKLPQVHYDDYYRVCP